MDLPNIEMDLEKYQKYCLINGATKIEVFCLSCTKCVIMASIWQCENAGIHFLIFLFYNFHFLILLSEGLGITSNSSYSRCENITLKAVVPLNSNSRLLKSVGGVWLCG